MDYYNLDLLVDLIKEKNFKVIAIQCSDTNESVRLCDILQDLFPRESQRNFYILGDVLTGSCCLDIIATKRLNADCIVYIGDSCFFDLETEYYIFHLYHKVDFNFKLLEEKVKEFCSSVNFSKFLLVYSSGFHHSIEKVFELFINEGKELKVASCPDSNKFKEVSSNKFCNRVVYDVKFENGAILMNPSVGDVFQEVDMVLYLKDNLYETVSKSISLEKRCENFYEFMVLREHYSFLERRSWSQGVLMKRYLSVEKAKESENFAVVTLTKSFKNGNRLRRLLQEILLRKKKRCTLMCINHLTEAKLQNFPRIETWVLISCNLTHLSLERELERLVVFPYELLVSLDVLDWTEDTYFFEFEKLSRVLEEYLANNYPEGLEVGSEEESLNTFEKEQLRTSTKMELSRRFEDLYETISSNEKREFRGLDPEYNFDKPSLIVTGSSGTPASYKHELKYQ